MSAFSIYQLLRYIFEIINIHLKELYWKEVIMIEPDALSEIHRTYIRTQNRHIPFSSATYIASNAHTM